MARLVGIDIRKTHVRAVQLVTRYRKVSIERMAEMPIGDAATLAQALGLAVAPLLQSGDAISVGIDGEAAFIHRIQIPATALKRIEQVVPFEIEAQIPIGIDELAWDYRLLRRRGDEPLVVLAGAARAEAVRQRIELLKSTLGREPERVGCGPLPLANLSLLSPELAVPGPIALVDLGGSRTEVVVLGGGEPLFARTLSRGVDGLPQSAPALASELRQTLAAWSVQGGSPVTAIHLLGGGSFAPGAEQYIASELGIGARMLPALDLQGLDVEQSMAVPRFAKAIGLAMGLSGRPRGLNLRRGQLAFQHGLGFVKERAPLLVGLCGAIFVSFLFSTWVELRTLAADHEVLEASLGTISKDVLGEETTDPARVGELFEKGKVGDKSDPMPHMDAFDVLVELSRAVPPNVIHDVQELDMQRGHVKVNGVVGTTEDAQIVASALGKQRCFGESVKIGKLTQMVGSERQKYILDLDVKCPEDDHGAKKKKPDAPSAPTGTAGGGTP